MLMQLTIASEQAEYESVRAQKIADALLSQARSDSGTTYDIDPDDFDDLDEDIEESKIAREFRGDTPTVYVSAIANSGVEFAATVSSVEEAKRLVVSLTEEEYGSIEILDANMKVIA